LSWILTFHQHRPPAAVHLPVESSVLALALVRGRAASLGADNPTLSVSGTDYFEKEKKSQSVSMRRYVSWRHRAVSPSGHIRRMRYQDKTRPASESHPRSCSLVHTTPPSKSLPSLPSISPTIPLPKKKYLGSAHSDPHLPVHRAVRGAEGASTVRCGPLNNLAPCPCVVLHSEKRVQ
jgi:hypothetical protein